MINTLHLGLSYNCNMKCKHCFVNKFNDNLDLDKLYKSIDYLDENGLFFIIYTFGEPLLAKNFWEISNYVSKKNIVQTLMTNGSILNDDIIEKLKANKVNNIYISIDSSIEEKHDANRNFVGAYKKATENLKKLSENGFNVGIATTINDSNIKEMDEIVDLAKKLNVKNISFLRQRENGKIVSMQLEKEYYDFYNKYLENYENYNLNILFHDMTLIPKTIELYNNKKITKSLYEKYKDMNSCHLCSTLSIEPNGNVKKCNLLKNSIGNLNANSIEEILNVKGETKNESIDNCS